MFLGEYVTAAATLLLMTGRLGKPLVKADFAGCCFSKLLG